MAIQRRNFVEIALGGVAAGARRSQEQNHVFNLYGRVAIGIRNLDPIPEYDPIGVAVERYEAAEAGSNLEADALSEITTELETLDVPDSTRIVIAERLIYEGARQGESIRGNDRRAKGIQLIARALAYIPEAQDWRVQYTFEGRTGSLEDALSNGVRLLREPWSEIGLLRPNEIPQWKDKDIEALRGALTEVEQNIRTTGAPPIR